jgi:hypothetical protein
MTMRNLESTCDQTARRPPWNKGKLIGAKPRRPYARTMARAKSNARIHSSPFHHAGT